MDAHRRSTYWILGHKAIEFVEQGDEAGDVMFYTGWNGQVTRVTGLRDVYSQADVADLQVDNILSSAGAAVTGLSVDPNDPNHVVVTVGGYGSSSAGKVRESFNALSDDVTWSNIWTGNGLMVWVSSTSTTFLATTWSSTPTIPPRLWWAPSLASL